MKARNPSTGTLETVYVKALDSMPVGTIVDYDGQVSDIPTGWETYGTGQIKKTSETRALAGHIVNEYNDSQTSAYSTEYINDCNTYSTSETFTGKYWIDNKPIYRTLVNAGSSSTSGQVNHNIENIDSICYFYSWIVSSSSTSYTYYPQPWFNNMSEGNFFKASCTRTKIDKSANNSWGFTVWCIVEYTKTTD